jgi:hypothetical protein
MFQTESGGHLLLDPHPSLGEEQMLLAGPVRANQLAVVMDNA